MLTKNENHIPGYILLIKLERSLTLYNLRYFDLGKYMQSLLISKLQRLLELFNFSIIGPLFEKHKILNDFDSFKLKLGTFMYKQQTNLLPKTFSNYFFEHNQVH